MSKSSKEKETYKKEREPRTRKRKVEEERIRENPIPSRSHIQELLTDEGIHE